MATDGRSDDRAAASTPPTTPPSEAPAPMRAMARLAECGSQRSLTSDQKPDTRVAPKNAMYR